MADTIKFPDEFEEFRARSYSGGCRQAMINTTTTDDDNEIKLSRPNYARGRSADKSPCPAEFDTSDSEDERGKRRFMSVEARNRRDRSPSPRHRTSGSVTVSCTNRTSPGLNVPRAYRARSASPHSSSIMSARSRARMKAEELRRMMAKKSEDSQDEYHARNNREITMNKSPYQKRRTSGSKDTTRRTSETRSDSGVNPNRNNASDFSSKSNALDSRFLSHMSCVVLDADDEIGDMRPRVSTEPTRTLSRMSFRSKLPLASQAIKEPPQIVHTVRHFTITSKGSVVSQGEYLCKSSTSLGSCDSGNTTYSAASDDAEDYTVIFVGDPGVGKRALIDRFLPQENTCHIFGK